MRLGSNLLSDSIWIVTSLHAIHRYVQRVGNFDCEFSKGLVFWLNGSKASEAQKHLCVNGVTFSIKY
jgi:hypothetical protein